MKKIVALVLSLVMVLGLATVAFADVTSTELKVADGYAMYAIEGTLGGDSSATKFTKTVTGNATDALGVVTYTADQYVSAEGKYWNEVDVSVADTKLVNVKTNTVVAYLKYAGTTSTKLTATAVATAAVDAAVGTPECGEYAEDVVIVKGVPYAVDTTSATYAVLNGKFVPYDATQPELPVAHVFTEINEVKADKTPVNVKCDNCKEVFAVTKDVTAMVNGYQQLTFAEGAGYFALIAAPAASAPAADADKVESAQTFDAGIAMYVGMSVMAAAGSAVVLKKKD